MIVPAARALRVYENGIGLLPKLAASGPAGRF